MPEHFGRFRILNDSPTTNVAIAQYRADELPLTYTAVGMSTLFPVLEQNIYAEDELAEDEMITTKLVVNLKLEDGKSIKNWELDLDGEPLWSVDIVVQDGPGNTVQAVATVTTWFYKFEVKAPRQFQP